MKAAKSSSPLPPSPLDTRPVHVQLLGAFAELRKATLNFIMSLSVHLPAHVEQLCSHWTNFRKTWHLSISRKSVEKAEVLLKSNKNNVKTHVHYWSHFAQFFLEWEMFQAKVVEKIDTHFMFNNIFFFGKSCRLWRTVQKYRRVGQSADDMAHAHCMLDTHGYKHAVKIRNFFLCMCIRASFMKLTRDTHLMQQFIYYYK